MPSPSTPLRWLRERDARRYLGNVSPRTWKRWEADGAVKGFFVGKMKLYDVRALDRQVLRSAGR